MKTKNKANPDDLLRAKRFCTCLDILGVTPIECAERLDNTPAYVYMLQSGQKPISDKTAARIATALNVDPEYIKGSSPFMTKTEQLNFLKALSANDPREPLVLQTHFDLLYHLGFKPIWAFELDMTPKEVHENMPFICHFSDEESIQAFYDCVGLDENGIQTDRDTLPRHKITGKVIGGTNDLKEFSVVCPLLVSLPFHEDIDISILPNGSFLFSYHKRYIRAKVCVSIWDKNYSKHAECSLPELKTFFDKFDSLALDLLNNFLLSD